MRDVRIQIERLEDGKTVEFTEELYTADDYNGLFLWEDGNYSCDCNRALFFNRELGLPAPSEDEPLCGNKKYRVNWIKDAVTSELLYEETTLNS